MQLHDLKTDELFQWCDEIYRLEVKGDTICECRPIAYHVMGRWTIYKREQQLEEFESVLHVPRAQVKIEID